MDGGDWEGGIPEAVVAIRWSRLTCNISTSAATNHGGLVEVFLGSMRRRIEAILDDGREA